jgi:hypothetical protein
MRENHFDQVRILHPLPAAHALMDNVESQAAQKSREGAAEIAVGAGLACMSLTKFLAISLFSGVADALRGTTVRNGARG